jgi:hypothetical protein
MLWMRSQVGANPDHWRQFNLCVEISAIGGIPGIAVWRRLLDKGKCVR